jgi:hypothetical protein
MTKNFIQSKIEIHSIFKRWRREVTNLMSFTAAFILLLQQEKLKKIEKIEKYPINE